MNDHGAGPSIAILKLGFTTPTTKVKKSLKIDCQKIALSLLQYIHHLQYSMSQVRAKLVAFMR